MKVKEENCKLNRKIGEIEMRKSEKYIYIIIGIIVIGVIAACVTFALLNDKDSNYNNTNNNQNENVDKTKEEKVTLTNEELEKYLSYIPKFSSYDPYDEKAFNDYNAYSYKEINANSIDKKALVANILTIYFFDCINDSGTCLSDGEIPIKYLYDDRITDGSIVPKADMYVPLSYVNEVMNKMYNTSLTDLTESKTFDDLYLGADGGWAYQNEYFLKVTSALPNDGTIINYLDSYNIENNDLIIYEYVSKYDIEYSKDGLIKYPKLIDYHNHYEVDISNICDAEDDACIKNYLKDNKDKFTKYKHIFKKNNTGYYWYSTEVSN